MVSAGSSRRHHLLIIEAVPARSRRLETCIETGADAFRPEPWTCAPAPRPIRSTGLGCSMRGFHASVRQTDGHDLATPEGLRLLCGFYWKPRQFERHRSESEELCAIGHRTSLSPAKLSEALEGRALHSRVQTSPGTQVMGVGGGDGSSGTRQSTGISKMPSTWFPSSSMAGEKRALRITAVQAAASRSP